MSDKNTESRQKNIAAMMKAKSLAIVGISRPDRFGGQVYANLQLLGYKGRIYGVNPGYETLYGQKIYPRLSDLPETPDCAILAVGNSRLLPTLKEAANLAIPSAVIYANAHGEADGISVEKAWARVAKESGMAVCGPNGLGIISYHQKLVMSGAEIEYGRPAGNITFISHSGSIWDSVHQNGRGIDFNYVISSGNEMVTNVADYMLFALSEPSTKIIGLFLETVRDPDSFCEALKIASERDIPVVALKVGRSKRGAQLAQAHTGALAGEDATYDALFKYYGVQRVRSMDEMMDTLELFESGMRPHNSKLAAILDSGGERSMLVDFAEDNGVEFAELIPKSIAKLDEILEPGIKAENPLDAFGTNFLWEQVFTGGMKVLNSDPEAGLTVLCVDLFPRNTEPPTYESMTIAIKDEFKKPFAVLANVSATAADFKTAEFRAAGIPVLMGTETGVRAIKHLFDYAEFQRELQENKEQPSKLIDNLPSKEKIAEIRKLLQSADSALGEVESKQILSEYGIRVCTEQIANSLDQALEVADEIGFPVVLKTAAGATHKTEVNGIHLNLSSPEELTSAYKDLKARLGRQVVVQEMISEGVELLLGIIDDSQFGSLLMVGIGGILVEVMKDTKLIWLPTNAEKVEGAIRSLKFAEILNGVRGQEKSDLNAIVDTTLRLAHFATDCRNLIAELD
ncbi:MAG: acetate--CoA ligase family protein, partial [Planctomycetota bacterium]